MQATGNSGTFERLITGILLPCGHQTRHLILSKLNLATAKSRERLNSGQHSFNGAVGRPTISATLYLDAGALILIYVLEKI